MSFNLDLSRFDKQYAVAQRWVDNEVMKDTEPFVPMNTGTLARSVSRGTIVGSGLIVYDTIYARRLYYGLGYNFKQDKHPQAQAQWFEGAKASHGEKWVSGVKKLAGRG